jgi:hypothetical protein
LTQAKIRRSSFSIRGQTTKADIYFLNVLALYCFDRPYKEKEIREKTHEKVRELVADLELPIHPQEIHQRILYFISVKKLQKKIDENEV